MELLELDASEQLDGLRNGTIDLGVMHGLIETPDLSMATLVREELLAALPATHAVARNERIDLATLSDETFLVPNKHEFGGLHEVVIGACDKAGFVPRRILQRVCYKQPCVWQAKGSGLRWSRNPSAKMYRSPDSSTVHVRVPWSSTWSPSGCTEINHCWRDFDRTSRMCSHGIAEYIKNRVSRRLTYHLPTWTTR